MRKNLDERARKKAFDELFERYDHNRNGRFFLIRVIFEIRPLLTSTFDFFRK